MISVERSDRIAVLRLSRDVPNALNLELVTELAGALEEVKRDPSLCGMVLTSANEKIFSLGFDIPWLCEAGQEQVGRFFRLFNRTCLELYTLPKPTLAAINGHAVAGGCILALCCDYRYVAEGRKLMGLNEIRLGVPVPYLPDCILRQLAGVRNGRDIMDTGEFYPPERLLQMGVVDEVLPPEAVLPGAVAKATELSKSLQAFALIKENRVEEIRARVLQHGEEKDRAFLECWFSEETQERLREAIKKF
jgi:enoyl-CoA hydratase/carnithine racemase